MSLERKRVLIKKVKGRVHELMEASNELASRLNRIHKIIEAVNERCIYLPDDKLMSISEEITEAEIREIYRLSQ